ncbi:MAG: NAD(P)-dependent oxidoreductase [Veillonellales bacterium]
MDKYDIIHFESLGPEAQYLDEETKKAQQGHQLPEIYRYLITPDNVQDFLKKNPEITLPDIITTKTHSALPASYLTGHKKSIVTRSTGYDHYEHLAAKANITSLREYCVNAVAQTAIKFLYAAAGELNHYTINTATFERKKSRAFMELNKHRIVTIFGIGKIGKKIYDLIEANDLTAQGVDIRQEQLDSLYKGKVKFVSKEEAVKSSDIIINAMNLTKNSDSKFYNQGYFSQEYLSQAKPGLIFINVTRGEIAPESVLLELYAAGRISGLGLDVFSNEAEFENELNTAANSANPSCSKTIVGKALDRSANIYVQPHQAFNSDVAARTKARETINHIIAWYKNNKQGFDEQLPYY